MTPEKLRRVNRALYETDKMREKLERAYALRPAHLRTDDDRNLIEFYRGHCARLTDMLEKERICR